MNNANYVERTCEHDRSSSDSQRNGRYISANGQPVHPLSQTDSFSIHQSGHHNAWSYGPAVLETSRTNDSLYPLDSQTACFNHSPCTEIQSCSQIVNQKEQLQGIYDGRDESALPFHCSYSLDYWMVADTLRSRSLSTPHNATAAHSGFRFFVGFLG